MKNGTRIGILAALFAACISLNAQTLKEAVKLTENEQYDLAADAFRKLVAAQPAGGTEYFYYGENALLAEDKDSARIIFTKGMEVDPANVLNSIGLAKIELDNGNPEKGMRLIDDALAKAGPKNVLVFIEAADALIHFKTKDLNKAAGLLDKALALDNKNPDIHILYGDLYSQPQRNQGSAAAEQYNKALDLDKTSVRAIVAKGKLYKNSTNYDGAAEEFRRAIQINPNFAPAHRELGEAYIKMGKLEEAKAEYKKFLELSGNNCKARVRYATFLYIGKDYAGALAEIDQVRQKCDTNNLTYKLTLLRVASYCFFEIKDCVKGAEVIQRLFNILPEEKRTLSDYEYYGKLMVCANNDSLGAEGLRKAYQMDRTRIDLLLELGSAYTKMKKYDDAAATYKEKIQYGKDVKSADYFKLGQSYFWAQRFQEADTAFNKLAELQPKWATGFLWNAKNKTRIDSTSEAGLARPMYEKYIELALADSANKAKYTEGLKEAYGYLASYHFLQLKDNANTLLYLRNKRDLLTDPAEKKEIQDMINQIEGKNKPR